MDLCLINVYIHLATFFFCKGHSPSPLQTHKPLQNIVPYKLVIKYKILKVQLSILKHLNLPYFVNYFPFYSHNLNRTIMTSFNSCSQLHFVVVVVIMSMPSYFTVKKYTNDLPFH